MAHFGKSDVRNLCILAFVMFGLQCLMCFLIFSHTTQNAGMFYYPLKIIGVIGYLLSVFSFIMAIGSFFLVWKQGFYVCLETFSRALIILNIGTFFFFIRGNISYEGMRDFFLMNPQLRERFKIALEKGEM